jgi:spermidine/putrescine transport system ATP-binding protein
VASFIGSSSLLSGTYRHGTVETGSGIDIQVGARDVADGEAVDVVVRPEHLAAGVRDGQASFQAKLETIVFVGSDLHLHGRLADGTEISALHRHARGGSGFKAGETVAFGYDPAALHVMKGASP